MDGLAAYLDSRGNWISDCDASGLLTCQRQCILLELTDGQTDWETVHLIADLSPLSLERVPHHSEPEAEICVPVVMRAGARAGLLPPFQIVQCWLASRFLALSLLLAPPRLRARFCLICTFPSPSIHSENNLDPSSLLSFCPKSVRLTRSLGYRSVV